jgi:hypothetical protein
MCEPHSHARVHARVLVRGAAARTLAALAAALMAITLPFAEAHAAARAEPVTSVEVDAGRLFIVWSGEIKSGMAEFVGRAVRQHAAGVREVALVLNSPGGSVAEGERVIRLLHDMKRTHRVTTAVFAGSTCGSMCVPVFLAGQRRAASNASLWLFHEVTFETAKGARTDAEQTRRLIEAYFVPAGVSSEWLGGIIPGMKKWRTGAELIAEQTGIVTERLPERQPRGDLATDAAAPAGGKHVEQ